MRKKMAWMGVFAVLFLLALPMTSAVVARADAPVSGVISTDVPITPTVSDAVPNLPVIPVAQGHWWSGIVSTILAAAIAALTALVGWLTNNIKTWVAQKASKENTLESAAWYGTAIYLAKIAVAYAKNKYGPGTPTAKDIVADATKFLKDRLEALDKDIVDPVKNPKLQEMLEGFVYAVYNLPFEAASPLAAAPISKPV